MFIDLRKYGKPFMISSDNAALDLSKITDLKVKVQTLNAGFDLQFISRDQADEFLSLFTNSRGNI